jgi:PAS domain S-box-containing protein
LKEAQQIAQIGHWDWDVHSNRLTWSDNMYNIYGVNAADGINYEKFISLIHPDDREKLQQKIESALQTQAFNEFFHRIVTPAGETKIMHAKGEVIVDKNGKTIRLVGTGQDVTKQKLLEQQLIETNKKIEERNRFVEKLINSSLDLVMVLDKNLRLITINRKAETLFRKVYKSEINGKKITDINPALMDSEIYQDLLNAFKGNIIIRDKVKGMMGGEEFYEHNYIPLSDENEKVYAVMIISHDITENIRQIEELRKLSESDEQKNNFIAMASHELKTPITSIQGYVQLLSAVYKDENKVVSPLLMRSSLISIEKQVKRLTRLISELLDLSKIEAGKLTLNKEQFNLNALLIDMIQDILYTDPKHVINVFHDLECDVYADKDRIGQVIINLLTNAIKYSPGSEKIDVWIKKAGHNHVAVVVKDYGIGIDEHERDKIFDRFYRVKGKEAETYPGFGIGLFIAKDIIQKHGGEITLKSEINRGTEFTFTLPVFKKISS